MEDKKALGILQDNQNNYKNLLYTLIKLLYYYHFGYCAMLNFGIKSEFFKQGHTRRKRFIFINKVLSNTLLKISNFLNDNAN